MLTDEDKKSIFEEIKFEEFQDFLYKNRKVIWMMLGYAKLYKLNSPEEIEKAIEDSAIKKFYDEQEEASIEVIA